MTTPDHRPYAGPTDLVTAEDGLRYVESFPPHMPACEVGAEYEARLDRERRQACRRGALAEWRAFADEAGGIDWTGESLDVWGNRRRALGALSRALAFRAAARAR